MPHFPSSLVGGGYIPNMPTEKYLYIYFLLRTYYLPRFPRKWKMVQTKRRYGCKKTVKVATSNRYTDETIVCALECLIALDASCLFFFLRFALGLSGLRALFFPLWSIEQHPQHAEHGHQEKKAPCSAGLYKPPQLLERSNGVTR